LELLVTSPWVPVEWIEAHGLAPRGVWSLPCHSPGAVTEGVCAFAERARRLTEIHPETPVLFTTACDQMRRAADAVGAAEHQRVFLFNLPATWQTPSARRLYHSEVERLGKFLRSLGGRAPTAAGLEAVMHGHDQLRAQLRRFIERGSARQSAEAMTRFFSGGPLPQDVPEASDRGVPLALVGGPLLASQWALFDTLESAGGRVVLNALEPGERCLLPPRPLECAGQDPVGRLCDHYFDHIVDVFQRPNSRLYAWLGARLAQRRVRGVVLWVHVGCDLWRGEAASLREAFGLPVLVLDTPDVPGGGWRDLNRLSAFIESLQ
jgi:benzoyl-CoA reductase/2-hydroxyglutaryl-CoA dehydratase subunit BcrC/BadD/HgdB